jgi:hypothetical protein
MQHHAFVIEAGIEEGIEQALAWTEKELGLKGKGNPDVIVLKYGLFSVADARRVNELAMQAPLRGTDKVIIIAATRAYHEAQNALLKLFEEPSADTHLFLILPTLGGLLPTLRSRVSILDNICGFTKPAYSEEVNGFLKATKEKRSLLIKKLSTGKDEDERRENRDRALEIVNGVEAALYTQSVEANAETLSEIAILRGYLYDRSAPVRMILEHLSLVLPKSL